MRHFLGIYLSYKNVTICFLLILLCYALPALALSPEIEADRLYNSAKKHLGTPEATVEFQKIKNIKVKMPTEYYYFYSKHLYQLGSLNDLEEANKSLETFLAKAVRNSHYYLESLDLLDNIEKDIKSFTRFNLNNDGTVTDTETGLVWAHGSRGSGMTWYQAETFCEDFQVGPYDDWRLPTVEELETLRVKKNRGKLNESLHCDIYELFNISKCYPVAAYKGAANWLPYVSFYNPRRTGDTRYWDNRLSSNYYRVLPVRNVDLTEVGIANDLKKAWSQFLLAINRRDFEEAYDLCSYKIKSSMDFERFQVNFSNETFRKNLNRVKISREEFEGRQGRAYMEEYTGAVAWFTYENGKWLVYFPGM